MYVFAMILGCDTCACEWTFYLTLKKEKKKEKRKYWRGHCCRVVNMRWALFSVLLLKSFSLNLSLRKDTRCFFHTQRHLLARLLFLWFYNYNMWKGSIYFITVIKDSSETHLTVPVSLIPALYSGLLSPNDSVMKKLHNNFIYFSWRHCQTAFISVGTFYLLRFGAL